MIFRLPVYFYGATMSRKTLAPGGLAGYPLLGVLAVVVLFWVSTLWGSFLSGFSVLVLKFISLGVMALFVIPKVLGLPFGRVSLSSYLEGIYLRLTERSGRQVVLGVVTGILLALSLLAANGLVGEVVIDWSRVDATQMGEALVHGVWEEVLFHGVVLVLCLRRMRQPLLGMVLAAAVFGGLHLNVFHFLRLFCMAMLWIAMIVETGSLLPAVLSHLVYDLVFAAFTPVVPEGQVFVWLAVWQGLVALVCVAGIALTRVVMRRK